MIDDGCLEMFRFAVLAIMAAMAAVGVAQTLTGLGAAHRGADAQAAVAIAPTQSSSASISKAADGHYWTQADVDGHAVTFLVDTGATTVALTADDARRLGIDVANLDYTDKVATANGEARAARVTLASIAVAGVKIDNVEAYVLDRGLSTSLLGMTYLGRLSSFEASPTSMILRP
jgi:aspartyl protease family protein